MLPYNSIPRSNRPSCSAQNLTCPSTCACPTTFAHATRWRLQLTSHEASACPPPCHTIGIDFADITSRERRLLDHSVTVVRPPGPRHVRTKRPFTTRLAFALTQTWHGGGLLHRAWKTKRPLSLENTPWFSRCSPRPTTYRQAPEARSTSTQSSSTSTTKLQPPATTPQVTPNAIRQATRQTRALAPPPQLTPRASKDLSTYQNQTPRQLLQHNLPRMQPHHRGRKMFHVEDPMCLDCKQIWEAICVR